jgi:L-histidine N-alpha-methyltransferase
MQKDLTEQFAADVLSGFSASPKYLSSKYFYDEIGSRLFEEIMQLPEYYLTNAEFEIFLTQSVHIVSNIAHSFHVIELGPGNGLKSKLLLKEAANKNKLLTYYPIDISPDALETLSSNLLSEMDIKIHPVANEYVKGIAELDKIDEPKLLMFLGSNIGNFSHADTVNFFSVISSLMKKGDHFLIGFDLKKDPHLILDAYNDSKGVTRAFNLNLLNRINRELGGNFDVVNFTHYPTYDPMSGEARSYLISEKEQIVRIEYLKKEFTFSANEAVYMEVSRKYDVAQIENYATSAGLKMVNTFRDCKHYFADVLFVKTE